MKKSNEKLKNALRQMKRKYAQIYRNAAKEEAAMDMAVPALGTAGLSEAENAELKKIEGLISREDAEKKIRENKIFNIGNDFNLQSMRLSSDRYEKDKYYYSLEFSKESKDNYAYYSVRIDAKDASLISFSGYDSKRDKEQKDAKKDREKAKEYAKILSGDKFSEFSENEDTNENSTVSYTRKIDGIDFENNTIGADVYNGQLIRYNIIYSDVSKAPSPQNAIDEKEALCKLSEAVDFGLYYVPGEGKYNLAYGFDDSFPTEIDAFSGKLLQSGIEYKKEEPQEYTDISGHFAEIQIKTLAQFGISFEGDEFKPDEKILQKDFISLLVSTFYNYSPITIKTDYVADDVYATAIRQGIIKEEEKNPDGSVSRSEAAVFIIRALGIEEYAKLPGIYTCPFSDVKENVGYVSILGAMGVFNGAGNNKFLPDKNLTRAEAVVCIYNYLSR